MPTTTYSDHSATQSWDGTPSQRCPDELLSRYDSLVIEGRLLRAESLDLKKVLGFGGQGKVFLSERRGIDNFTLPVAVKVFSPERYQSEVAYRESMLKMAEVAASVAQIQHDNLLDVHNWSDQGGIRMMEMEWVDGCDLKQLLDLEAFRTIRDRVSEKRWHSINAVVATSGRAQAQIKPGVAVAIVRDCLAALSALHRAGIIHGDIKPSNIMIKRTGHAKIIDIGSAFFDGKAPVRRTCTPTYAAPEVLESREPSPQSDLASLGYVLIEMLSGMPIFPGLRKQHDLLDAKRFFAQEIKSILPREVVRNALLMNFCTRLISPDPKSRFASAQDAVLVEKEGAAAFLRQLIKGNLASEYDHEMQLWIEEFVGLDRKPEGDLDEENGTTGTGSG